MAGAAEPVPLGERTIARRPLVQIESPLSAHSVLGRELNDRYLRACLRDSLLRGEAPYASHALYAREDVLDDDDPVERRMGMEAGFAFLHVVDRVAVYTDLGVSVGMREGIARAHALGLDVEDRRLGSGWMLPHQGV